ncbi:MAG: hypothetical protein J6X70_09015 [Muribaculaceae bacterium]|nr:hypothetical protein [Muribaculaceae bacterium]
MKKMFFALMAVLAVTTVSAQDNGQQDERKRGREGRVEMMTKELNLTEAQKTQMTALMDDTQKKLEALEQQKKEIFESQKARMEQILTEEQLAKFKEMGSRHHGPRHGDFKGGPRPDFKDGPRPEFNGEGPCPGDFKDKGEFRGRGHRGHGPRHHGKPAGEGCDKCKDCPQEGEAQAK